MIVIINGSHAYHLEPEISDNDENIVLRVFEYGFAEQCQQVKEIYGELGEMMGGLPSAADLALPHNREKIFRVVLQSCRTGRLFYKE